MMLAIVIFINSNNGSQDNDNHKVKALFKACIGRDWRASVRHVHKPKFHRCTGAQKRNLEMRARLQVLPEA